MQGRKNEVKKRQAGSEEKPVQVSVIMPAYRCADTIAEALESALMQDVSLEVIVVNDCSPDALDAVMERYRDDARVRYVHNTRNLGASGSRNRGVSLARGTYIAFLDADDRWVQGKLKKQLALLQKEDAVLCSTGRELLTPAGVRTGRVIGVQPVITYRMLLRHNSINCSSVLLRAEVAREFPMEHEDSHEDYILWLRILKKYGRAVAINEPLLLYRLSAGGKSGSKLQSARMTYLVYRYVGLGPVRSAFCFAAYAVNGVWKYGKAYIRGALLKS